MLIKQMLVIANYFDCLNEKILSLYWDIFFSLVFAVVLAVPDVQLSCGIY